MEDEKDRATWEQMSANIMSDQEGTGKKVLFKRPHWIPQANEIIERIVKF